MVCLEHFKPSDFGTTFAEKLVLSKGAVPSVFRSIKISNVSNVVK